MFTRNYSKSKLLKVTNKRLISTYPHFFGSSKSPQNQIEKSKSPEQKIYRRLRQIKTARGRFTNKQLINRGKLQTEKYMTGQLVQTTNKPNNLADLLFHIQLSCQSGMSWLTNNKKHNPLFRTVTSDRQSLQPNTKFNKLQSNQYTKLKQWKSVARFDELQKLKRRQVTHRQTKLTDAQKKSQDQQRMHQIIKRNKLEMKRKQIKAKIETEERKKLMVKLYEDNIRQFDVIVDNFVEDVKYA